MIFLLKGSTPRPALAATIAAIVLLASGTAEAAFWNQGDVFVPTEALDQEPTSNTVRVKVYDKLGTLKEEINTGFDRNAFQCAFNSTLDRLYVPAVDDGAPSGVVLASLTYNNAHPHALIGTIDPVGANSGRGFPASVVSRPSDRHIFVGYRNLASDIYEYDANGTFVRKYDVATSSPQTGNTAAGFIDLSTDGKTIFYTDGPLVRRFDVVANVQLANFALLGAPHGDVTSLRLLSPGNGSGGLLVSDGVRIQRLGQNGQLLNTYNYFGYTPRWLSLDLDPNRTSFWALAREPSSGGITNHNSGLFRFNIATGVIELGPVRVFSGTALCVKGGASAKLSKFGSAQSGVAGANGQAGANGPNGQPVGTPVP